MGSGGRNREQQNYYNAQVKADTAALAQPDPNEVAYKQQQTNFLNWENTPGHNVADAPGLSDYIQIGRAAQQRANQQRMGTGALALGEGGASGYAAKLNELQKAQQGEDFGTGLEDALAARTAEAHGSVLPMAQLALQRKSAVAGVDSNMFGMWSARKSKNFWDYMMDASQMVGNVGGGIGAAKGCWVAEAIYGETDPRTFLVRGWLNLVYKHTFIGGIVMAFYLRFGERVAAKVRRHNILKKILRPLFDKALKRAMDMKP